MKRPRINTKTLEPPSWMTNMLSAIDQFCDARYKALDQMEPKSPKKPKRKKP